MDVNVNGFAQNGANAHSVESIDALNQDDATGNGSESEVDDDLNQRSLSKEAAPIPSRRWPLLFLMA